MIQLTIVQKYISHKVNNFPICDRAAEPSVTGFTITFLLSIQLALPRNGQNLITTSEAMLYSRKLGNRIRLPTMRADILSKKKKKKQPEFNR